MLAVLDSNEFIYAFREEKQDCKDILKLAGLKFNCIISPLILEEVFQQIKELEGKNSAAQVLFVLRDPIAKIVYTDIPEHLVQRYKDAGLKEADATIAAFVEFVGADFLVSENRHSLKS